MRQTGKTGHRAYAHAYNLANSADVLIMTTEPALWYSWRAWARRNGGPVQEEFRNRMTDTLQDAVVRPSSSSLTESTTSRLIILLVAFINGFVIMSIELLGGRVLAPYFGSSVHVWGSIITVFMLSLSLGYLWGGKLSLGKAGPRTFAWFFIGAAILSLPIIFLAEDLMAWVFITIEDPRYGSLVTAMLLYFLPICVMGMVSPYSVRLLVSTQESSGGVAGLLYFVSTLGSALGTLATSFYFVLWFDVNHIMWGCAIALLGCAALVLFGARRAGAIVMNSNNERLTDV